jgi:glutamate synthase (NADPH/NADH) small chain
LSYQDYDAFISVEELYKNFKEVTPPLTSKQAIDESNRCLFCYDAPCTKACPTHIDVPSFIKKIATNNLKGSARVIMEANPVGATCARVCPTELLCEGACVLGEQPVMIGRLQRYATDWAIKNNELLFKSGPANGKKVAVIGGGPGGLSAARELARLGYHVTVFEAKEKAGGLDTYGIVSFRLPQAISLWEVEQIERMGVELKTGVQVGEDVAIEELKRNYDAIIVAIGLSNVPQLGIEGEQLDGVYDAIEFIEATKTKPLTQQFAGKRVFVIGAGNTAIDAATCSRRLGAENVQIIYRRTEKEMTAYPFEFEFAKQDGVEFRWLTAPTRILGEERVRQIELVRMKLGEPDDSGRRRPIPIAGSEFVVDVDVVIKAIGQSKHLHLIEHLAVEHERGVIRIDPVTHQTSDPKIYAVGDCVFGTKDVEAMVVDAAEQGKRAAYALHQNMTNNRETVA